MSSVFKKQVYHEPINEKKYIYIGAEDNINKKTSRTNAELKFSSLTGRSPTRHQLRVIAAGGSLQKEASF